MSCRQGTRSAARPPAMLVAAAGPELRPDDRALLAGLENALALYHRATLADVEPDDVPGYWCRRQPCGGLGRCPSTEVHLAVGWEGPVLHTIRYLDERRNARGRVTSPYRIWRVARELLAAGRWPRPLAADKKRPAQRLAERPRKRKNLDEGIDPPATRPAASLTEGGPTR